MNGLTGRVRGSRRGPGAPGRRQLRRLLLIPMVGLVLGCTRLGQLASPQPSDATIVAREDPLNPGQALHCSGIESLDPARATIVLQRLGWQVTYRWVYSTGVNTGYGETRSSPPDGVITGMVYGDPGWLVMVVSPPNDPQNRPITAPIDCPAGSGVPPS